MRFSDLPFVDKCKVAALLFGLWVFGTGVGCVIGILLFK